MLPLRISVQIGREKIQRIRLFSHHHLQVDFIGDPNPSLETAFHEWLQGYIQGSPPSLLQVLDTSSYLPLTKEVCLALLEIPFGKVCTYKELAKAVKRPQAIRAIASHCGRNIFPLVIPCHRIIRTCGGLGGFAEGIEVKKTLLNYENH